MESFIGRSSITAKDHADISGSVSIAKDEDIPDDDDGVDDVDYSCQFSVSSWVRPEHADTSSSAVSTNNGLLVKFSWPDNLVPLFLVIAGEVCRATRLEDVRILDLDLTENYIHHEEVFGSITPLVQTLKSLRSLSIQDSAGVDVDVSGMLVGTGFLRAYEDWTKEGHHWEVVRSAVPEASTGPGTPMTFTPVSPVSLPVDGLYLPLLPLLPEYIAYNV
ncbi:hypothetical protein EWM64_g10402 [Hericium alpestre]|uniref:Uncharacterized protein n=1 Tax=Hericium alpestre TaxID=135208 RepID=A0A4Y9ZJI9_9AGAM|nr:hypothetical protein EWM64_g10402 [Hericium alpestre]